MFRQLPIKKKHLLIAATAILFLFCYQLAFKRTLEAWRVNKQLQTKVAAAVDVSYQPAYVQRKNANLDRIIAFYKTDTTALRSSIVSAIGVLAEQNQVKLSEVPVQNPLYHTDQFIIQRLGFEGDFFTLLKMLNELQALKGIGIIRSAVFKATETRSGNNQGKKLTLEVYLETAII